jgi:hypothetical protein
MESASSAPMFGIKGLCGMTGQHTLFRYFKRTEGFLETDASCNVAALGQRVLNELLLILKHYPALQGKP